MRWTPAIAVAAVVVPAVLGTTIPPISTPSGTDSAPSVFVAPQSSDSAPSTTIPSVSDVLAATGTSALSIASEKDAKAAFTPVPETTTAASVSSNIEDVPTSFSAPASTSTSTSTSPTDWFGTPFDASKYETSNATAPSPLLDLPDDQLWRGAMPVCGTGKTPTPGVNPTLMNIDDCAYPSRSLFPVPTAPRVAGPDSEYRQTPSYIMWNHFRMDEWLAEAFRLCPIVTQVWNDNGEEETFSAALGRLMLGRDGDSFKLTVCDPNRCGWQSFSSGDGGCRGRVWAQDEVPTVDDNFDEEFVEAYRRWYAMYALVNMWDYYQSAKEAMALTRDVATTRIPSIFNAFLPGFQPPKSGPPRPSLLGDVLNIVQSIASFTPFSAEVNTLLAAGQLVVEGLNGGGLSSASKNKLSGAAKTVQWGSYYTSAKDYLGLGKPDEPTNDGLTDEQRAVVAAAKEARKGMAKTLGKAFLKVGSDIRKLINDAKAPDPAGTDASWDPQLPVALADVSDHFGAMFYNVANAMADTANAAINGNPYQDGGYLQMVKGGLFGLDASSKDTLDKNSAATMVPPYLAFMEDEMVKLIIKSQGLFYYRRRYSSLAECQVPQMPPELNWAGIVCVDQGDGTFASYTPFTKDLGYLDGSNRKQLFQVYNSMTTSNWGNVHSDASSAYNLDISDVIQASYECAKATIEAALPSTLYATPAGRNMAHPYLDQGTPFGSSLWPASFPGDEGKLAVNALAETCHWNIPIVTLDDPTWQTYCLASSQYVGGSQVDPEARKWGQSYPQTCNIAYWTTETDCQYGCHDYGDADDGHWAPGVALYWARSLLAEVPFCTAGTTVNCPRQNVKARGLRMSWD